MTIQWPKFCDIPFKLVKIPEDLYRDIMEVYHKSKFIELINDNCYDSVYGDMTTGGSISFKTFPYSKNPFYLRATPPLEKFSEWASSLQPLLEEWSNEKLEFVNGYGIRSYVHDS
ncbi:hypothetical protein EB169_10590, partial [archaeon]|nr:hypothetical protein [archaeon]